MLDETNLRLVFKSIAEAITLTGPTGKVVEANDAAARLHGFNSAGAMIGTSIFDLVAGDDRAKAREVVGSVSRGEAGGDFECLLLHKDGHEFSGELSFTAITDTGGNIQGLIIITRDVTERKQADEALRKSEEEYKTLFEGRLHGTVVIDRTMKVLMVNQIGVEMFGFNHPEETIGINILDYIAPEDRDRTERMIIEDVFGKGQRKVHEFRALSRHGNEIWINAEGVRIEYHGNLAGLISFRDITERRQAEQALRESEGKYRTLFEGRLYGTVVIDRAAKVLMVNQVAAEMFGFTFPEEAVGVDMFAYIAPEERERTRKIITESMFGNGHREVHEFRTLSRDGTEIWLDAEGVKIDFEGKVAGLISFRDITQKKRAEARLLEYQQELRSLASQLSLAEERERHRIATEIHDRATQTLALCSIRLGELLQSPAGASFARPLGEVHTLIKELIEETRSLTFQLSSPLLYEVGLEAALEYLSEQVEKDHGVVCHFEDDGQARPLSEDISVTLFQAVRELLVNVGKHARATRARVGIASRNRCVEITVEDNGIGFEASGSHPDRKASAPFRESAPLCESPARRTGRTGFGLFSIRERLRHLGGSLNVESHPGQGTRATIVSPLQVE